MILHRTAGSRISVTEARRLYAAASGPKRTIDVEAAGHLSAWECGAREPALKTLGGMDNAGPTIKHHAITGSNCRAATKNLVERRRLRNV
jgi:hypothetical protein